MTESIALDDKTILPVRLIGHNLRLEVDDLYRLFYGKACCLLEGEGTSYLESAYRGSQLTTQLVLAGQQINQVSRLTGQQDLRREVKRQIYLILSAYRQIQFPWGSLTGVKPTMIASRELARFDGNLDRAEERLVEFWQLSPEKARLALACSRIEEEILSSFQANEVLLYIGIPFCPSRCAYCSFISTSAERQAKLLPTYIENLLRELKEVASWIGQAGYRIKALYLGGGTPTSPKDKDFAKLIHGISSAIDLAAIQEVSVEAGRPDSINSFKLKTIRQMRPDVRISINPQTSHDRTLQSIGRQHSWKDSVFAFNLARDEGFDHINMDLIMGLPGETCGDFMSSLEQVVSLGPESISLHALALKRTAKLGDQAGPSLGGQLPQADWVETAQDAYVQLAAAGYGPYYLYRQKNIFSGLENVAFAKEGKACVYNVWMMSDRVNVLGVGSASSSKWIQSGSAKRQFNSKDMADYCARIDAIIEKKRQFFEDWICKK